MKSKFYVLVYDLDAFYGQSTDAQLRLIGPFDASHEADEWEEKHVDQDNEDSLTLPFAALPDGKLILRAQAPRAKAGARS